VGILSWFGLGKKRSKLGRWLDRHGISQTEFSKLSKVSRPTITRLCSDDEHQPNMKTANKVIRALKDLTGKDIDHNDFWSM
jgi:putative transcriptional regulator